MSTSARSTPEAGTSPAAPASLRRRTNGRAAAAIRTMPHGAPPRTTEASRQIRTRSSSATPRPAGNPAGLVNCWSSPIVAPSIPASDRLPLGSASRVLLLFADTIAGVKLSKTLGRIAGLLGLAALALPVAPRTAAEPPVAPAAESSQWIVVGVPAANSTTGTLTAFQRGGQQWKVVLGPTKAMVGELGIGAPADGVYRTPEGTFAFDQAFGREPNPGTKMPYFQATKQDWWDEDASSPTYNTYVHSVNSPSAITENLYDSGPVYDYAVNIAVNPQRIPGKVSGIFLHVTNGSPTWGCVAIGRDEMRSILTWLDPAASPRITIGVGSPSLIPAGS